MDVQELIAGLEDAHGELVRNERQDPKVAIGRVKTKLADLLARVREHGVSETKELMS